MYDKVKKLKGENYAKTIRSYNSSIFEIEGLVDLSLPALKTAGDWFLNCNESLTALKNKYTMLSLSLDDKTIQKE